MTAMIADALIGLSIGASLVVLLLCGMKVSQLVMDLMDWMYRYRRPR